MWKSNTTSCVKKSYIWNPSKSTYENGKYASITDDSVIFRVMKL